MEELYFVQRVRAAGGRPAIVGGWVRDRLRGTLPQDKDYVVSGMDAESFCEVFPDARQVGKSFPVYLLEIDGRASEIALARTERKAGPGYLGFEVCSAASITLEEDLSRRDTTINAMAMELFPDDDPPKLIDLFGGAEDIRRRCVRAVSEHFTEDPVRALRAARQAAVFGYTVESRTIGFMGACRDELMTEPGERIFGEMTKALSAEKPSVFFRLLLTAGLLDAIFPEIFALIGKTQPVFFHPEGDAFEHSMAVVDEVSRRTKELPVRFSALVHDLGKGLTPEEMLPHHYGHERRGLDALRSWNDRMTIPKLWMRVAEFVIREHMRAPRLKKRGKITTFLMELSRLSIPAQEVIHVFSVDHGSLPPYLADYEEIMEKLLAVTGNDAPKDLKGKKVGDWIHVQRTKYITEIMKGQGNSGREDT